MTFLALLNFSVSARQKTDVLPGQYYLRDTVTWGNMQLRQLDQRHEVGLVRLCGMLSEHFGITAIYTQGVNGVFGPTNYPAVRTQ